MLDQVSINLYIQFTIYKAHMVSSQLIRRQDRNNEVRYNDDKFKKCVLSLLLLVTVHIIVSLYCDKRMFRDNNNIY